MQATHLPKTLTTFIGREQELRALLRMLISPTCRLLTITGPGGVGKTQLAIEAARRLAENEAYPTGFVNLQPVETTPHLVQAIADVVRLPHRQHEPVRKQLFDFLRSRDMLLILDNVEQLLSNQSGKGKNRGQNSEEESAKNADDTATFLSELLFHAPDVRLVVTSRLALNLQEEWLFAVSGLPVLFDKADDASEEMVGVQDAVALFIERAQRVRHTFSHQDETDAIVQICELVEGMPLAIELAASWTKSLSCQAIAAEIEKSLGFLTTPLRNVPPRHRNMQAVFDQSWALLTEQEQHVLIQLAIFRGGFRRGAAEQVVEASLELLTALVDQSLLRWDPDGRYQIHELLRQFAKARLDASPQLAEQVQRRHAYYFAGFLHDCNLDMMSADGPRLAKEIGFEIDNIRQAWAWACTTADVVSLAQSCNALQYYYYFRGHPLEYLEMMEQAAPLFSVPVGSEHANSSLVFLNCLGLTYLRVGQLSRAKAILEEAQLVANDLTSLPAYENPLSYLGMVANSQGDYETARQLGLQAYQESLARNAPSGGVMGRYVEASALCHLGLYEEAYVAALEAQTIMHQTNAIWFEAFVLNDLGMIAGALGQTDRARGYYLESRRIKQLFGDDEGIAAASSGLANIARRTNNYDEAQDLYQQCITTYRKVGDRGGLARALHGLGDTLTALGNNEQAAQKHLHEALQIASEMEFWSAALAILTSISEHYLSTERHEFAQELLGVISTHPAADGETQSRVAALHTSNVNMARSTDDARNTYIPKPLPEVVAHVVDKMSVDIRHDSAVDEKTVPNSPPVDQPLIEPLTARELEVLHLIVEGLTNPEIADRLIIAVGTVKAYTGNIYGKLGVHNRINAVKRASELALISA